MASATLAPDERALVFHPESHARAELRDTLEKLGLRVATSGSAAEADMLIRQGPTTVAVVELKSFVQWRPTVADLPIIVVTQAPATPDEHTAALDAGADVVLNAQTAARQSILKHYVESAILARWARTHQAVPVESPSSSGAANGESSAGSPAGVRRAGSQSVAEAFALPAPDLQDRIGRLVPERIAEYLGVTLKDLVEGLGGKYSTVHKTPTGDSAQTLLRPVFNIIAILRQVFGNDRTRVLRWLRTPRAELRDQAPLDVMLQPGRIRAVDTLVSQAWLGVPD